MDKREKVIEHLQDCIDYLDGNRERHWVFVRGNVVRAAFQLLKAQEPRVMTLEEVKNSTGKDIFLEIATYPGNPSYITAATLDGVGTGGVTFYHNSFDFECYNKKTYGWRCWTSRPTDEQLKMVKWE